MEKTLKEALVEMRQKLDEFIGDVTTEELDWHSSVGEENAVLMGAAFTLQVIENS